MKPTVVESLVARLGLNSRLSVSVGLELWLSSSSSSSSSSSPLSIYETGWKYGPFISSYHHHHHFHYMKQVENISHTKMDHLNLPIQSWCTLPKCLRFFDKRGLLSFLMSFPFSYSEEMLPQHPAFTLLANSQQHLTKTVARRLITMKKVKSFNEVW